MKYASFGKRLGSGLLDYSIIFIMFYIISAFLIINLNLGEGDMQMAPFVTINIMLVPLNFLINIIRHPSSYGYYGDVLAYYFLFLMMVFVEFMYFTLMEVSPLKATIGYKSNGIQLKAINSDRIKIFAIVKRNCLKIVSRYLLCLPFFIAIITNNNQTIYDRLAGIVVVQEI